ncbi:MAG: hypothetical protein N3B21_05980 [Clostridia bacterium]|nr:hypothetical protein [Clostridia bacterium]
MSKVVLKLESPLMTGGKRLKDNVLESLDYIAGHVLRAAFARHILLNCPLYKPNQPDSKGRYHFVYIRDKGECRKCRLYEACRDFSDMKFSFFYPKGTDILPYTAKGCKYHDDHGFKDILTYNEGVRCSKCIEKYGESMVDMGKAGRVESVSGYRKRHEKISIERTVFTRTAIEPSTKTAQDGSLYLIYAVKQGIEFEGEIQGIEKLGIKEGNSIYVGSYNTVGFGRMSVQSISDEDRKKNLPELISEFNLKLHKHNVKQPTETKVTYIPILFKSDAKLGIERESFDRPMSNEEYKEKWKELIFGEKLQDIKIEKVLSENDMYRGYDTSQEWGKWEKKPQIITLKGTSVLLSTDRPIESVLPELVDMELQGVGEDKNNGFGQIEVCNELHVKGEI